MPPRTYGMNLAVASLRAAATAAPDIVLVLLLVRNSLVSYWQTGFVDTFKDMDVVIPTYLLVQSCWPMFSESS